MGVLLIALASAGCASGDLAGFTDARITLQNHSQFVLLDLRLHDGDPIRYDRLEGSPLAIGGELHFELLSQRYLTVVREKVSGGEQIAYSTHEPLPVYRGLYRLEIFDEAFRLHDEGPLPEADGGALDGGP